MKTRNKLWAVIAFTQITLLSSYSAYANSRNNKMESIPGEYVVRLKNNILKQKGVSSVASDLRSYIKSTIPSQNIVVIKRAVFENEKSVLSTLSENENVELVEPNYIYRTNKLPNDSSFEQLWGLKNIGQNDSSGKAGVAGMDINVEAAWDIQTGSKNTVVAVIDTGVDYNHPDLKENLWTNAAEANGTAGVDDDNNGVIDDIHGYNAITGSGNATDDQGHGSHCAGTIGGKGDNNLGVAGVNWDVSIMAIKFLSSDGSGSLEGAIKAIDYATKMNAKIMSNSWGGGGFSQILFDTIKKTETAGAVFIAAAGNDGKNNDSSPSYPASYAIDNVISVAAIDNKGAKASFSNYGKKSVHIGAPGVNIYSTTGGSYKSYSGTSMATPHVAGLAALLWSNETSLTAAEVKQRLLATARPLPSLRGKTTTGGMIDALAALTNTVPGPDLNDPINWNTTSLNVASASPYIKNTNQTFEVQLDATVKEFSLFFEKFNTEDKYDTVNIYDINGKLIQSLSGLQNESFSSIVTGNYAKIIFTTDSSVEKTGWTITKAAIR